jgi:hypothetical protein
LFRFARNHQGACDTSDDRARLHSFAKCCESHPFSDQAGLWQLTFYVCRRPESRPSGRRRAVHRPSRAFTFTARGGKARSAAAENVC